MTKHLWERLLEAKSRLEPVQSKYRVLFEDPATPDEPAKVLVPDPNWMACALEGNTLPPPNFISMEENINSCSPGHIILQ